MKLQWKIKRVNWIYHILRMNCVIKHAIERKINVASRRRRRRKQRLGDVKETRRHWKLEEEALEPIVWRTRFVRGYEYVTVTEEQGRWSKTRCWRNCLSRMEKEESKVYNEKFQGLWVWTYITRTIESRRIKWARHLTNIRLRYVNVFDGNVNKKLLAEPGHRYEDVIRMNLKKVKFEAWTNLFCS
jgi:hypothetical protein